MDREKEIYAKMEQIRLIDVILNSLCTTELSKEGRIMLKKIKKRLSLEVLVMKKARLNTTHTNLTKNRYIVVSA
jgi:hypothetical protein